MRFLHKLMLFFKRFGFRNGILRLIKYAFSFIYFCHEQVLLIKGIVHDSKTPDNANVRCLRMDDLGQLHGAMYKDLNLVKERLKNGDQCVVAIVDGRIASSCWVLFRFIELPDLDLKLPLPDKVAFEDTLVTDHEFRRKGYGRLVMQGIERVSAEKGCDKILLAINVDNIASRNLFKGLGYEIFKQVRLTRFLGIRRYRSIILIPEFARFIEIPSRIRNVS